jgi:hypothetical protein
LSGGEVRSTGKYEAYHNELPHPEGRGITPTRSNKARRRAVSARVTPEFPVIFAAAVYHAYALYRL